MSRRTPVALSKMKTVEHAVTADDWLNEAKLDLKEAARHMEEQSKCLKRAYQAIINAEKMIKK
jgi:hypothetical protein